MFEVEINRAVDQDLFFCTGLGFDGSVAEINFLPDYVLWDKEKGTKKTSVSARIKFQKPYFNQYPGGITLKIKCLGVVVPAVCWPEKDNCTAVLEFNFFAWGKALEIELKVLWLAECERQRLKREYEIVTDEHNRLIETFLQD